MPAINSTEDAMSIAMVQFSPEPATTKEEVIRNIERNCAYVDRASKGFPGVDLVVFPEYSTNGFGFDPYATQLALASTIPGLETELYGRKAKELGVWLCVSVLERADDPSANPYNSMVLINADGEVALKYRKMMPFCPKEPWTPGDVMPVCDGPKGSRLAIGLCFDFDYPEIAREAAWKGANVLLRPAKYMYPFDHIWDITNRARAFENLAYVVAVNHTGHDPSYSYFGHSMVSDYNANILSKMGDTEGMTKVDIYPSEVEAIRRDWISNNYLYELKHRGYTGVPPVGVTTNPFTIYRDWDVIPERWNHKPTGVADKVAAAARQALARPKAA